jgi:tryptophan synthase alpha chain
VPRLDPSSPPRIIAPTVNSPHPSLQQVFTDLKSRRQLGLVAFVPAGYPDMETTRAVLSAFERGGASVIEVGFPFSDPVADGPTVQEAFNVALSKKVKVADVFAAIRAARPSISIPMMAMLSHSIVFRYGIERFFKEAKESGFDGLIIPDLPPPEAQPICTLAKKAGLDITLLVSPTTTPERRKEIASLCTGFIYYLSVSGITGERDKLPADLEKNVKQLKELGGKPVCVGFGISKPEHLAQLAGLADGAIVGSGIVKRMKQHELEGPGEIAKAVEAYCRELLAKVR